MIALAQRAMDGPILSAASFAGVVNVRDLGGHATVDGRRVRRGLLFRGGSLAGLGAVDRDRAERTGAIHYCDLRTTSERARAPVAWGTAADARYWSRDCASSFGELHALMAAALPDGAAAADAMRAGYRRLPFEQADALNEIVARVVAGDVPLLFACSAGKDRAGIVAALLLLALGVPRATATADYLASNGAAFPTAGAPAAGIVSRQSPAVAAAIRRCDTTYLDAALAAIDERCGSLDRYFADRIGLDARLLYRLADRLLERGDRG